MTVYQLFHVQMLIQLVVLGVGFFIFPLIQLYLFPFTTKFNFIHEHEIGTTNEELEIIDKGQAFARNFLVLPFMYYLILTSFLPILQRILRARKRAVRYIFCDRFSDLLDIMPQDHL